MGNAARRPQKLQNATWLESMLWKWYLLAWLFRWINYARKPNNMSLIRWMVHLHVGLVSFNAVVDIVELWTYGTVSIKSGLEIKAGPLVYTLASLEFCYGVLTILVFSCKYSIGLQLSMGGSWERGKRLMQVVLVLWGHLLLCYIICTYFTHYQKNK